MQSTTGSVELPQLRWAQDLVVSQAQQVSLPRLVAADTLKISAGQLQAGCLAQVNRGHVVIDGASQLALPQLRRATQLTIASNSLKTLDVGALNFAATSLDISGAALERLAIGDPERVTVETFTASYLGLHDMPKLLALHCQGCSVNGELVVRDVGLASIPVHISQGTLNLKNNPNLNTIELQTAATRYERITLDNLPQLQSLTISNADLGLLTIEHNASLRSLSLGDSNLLQPIADNHILKNNPALSQCAGIELRARMGHTEASFEVSNNGPC